MRGTTWPILLLALTLPPAARAQSADEHEAGVTTASNPSVEGVPPTSQRRALIVGTTVFEHERVISAADGQAQLLFRDGSNFTVGPGSDLVIDDFVYDPKTNTGKIAASLGKGLFRFVGGALSKDGSVAMTTPTAVLGVRGGIALVEVSATGATTAALLHGDVLTVTSRTGITTRIERAGFAVSVPDTQSPPSQPARMSPDQLRQGFDPLRGQPGRAGGLTQPPPSATVTAELRAPITTGTAGGTAAAAGSGGTRPGATTAPAGSGETRPGATSGPTGSGDARPGATSASLPSPFAGAGPSTLQGPGGSGGAGGPGGPSGLGGRPGAMGPGGPGGPGGGPGAGQAGPPAPGGAQARQRRMFAPNAP